MTEIAEQLGFSSVHLFSRVFKQIVGVSPIVYMSKRTRKD
ncbi:AraC family transcriptional regulator [Pseudomonas sp. URIL14HWK12:I6]